MAQHTNGEGGKSTRWERFLQYMSDYKYRPLTSTDYTRLLYLWPKSKGEGIQGQLVEIQFHKLADIEEFSALSYHWGRDDSPQKWITLHQPSFAAAANGESPLKGKRYRVKENLFFALEALRQQNDPVLLWVDALCINQNDPIEKQEQLAKINFAYELAPSVIIWLGPEDKESGRREKAINFVKQITAADTGRDIKGMTSDPDYIDHWMSLVELTQLSWFSRKWVIQELALAKDAQVRCGSLQVPWHDLQVAIYLMERYSEQIRLLTKGSESHDHDYHAVGDLDTLEAKALVDTVHNMFKRDKDGAPVEPNLGLEYLVSALACFYSSDPRDTINAFRNISRETRRPTAVDDEKAPPKPTYTLDKTLAEIYLDFFRWVCETSGSIDIMCRKWALPEKLKRPSRIVTFGKDSETEYVYPELSIIPSYIQTVGMPAQNVHGSVDASAPARTEGISLVGLPVPGKAPYNASYSTRAQVHFNDTRRVHQPTDGEILTQPETDARTIRVVTINSVPGEPTVRPASPKSSQDGDGVGKAEGTAKPKPRSAPFTTMLDGVDLSTVVRPDGSKPPRKMQSSASLHGNETSHGTLPLQSIRVGGIQVGVVRWHTSSMQQGTIHADAIMAMAPDFAKKRATGQKIAPADISDKLWRGLVAERGADGDNPPPTYLSACRYIVQNCLSRDGSLNTRALMQKSKFVDFEKDYLNRVYAVSYNRSFFEAAQAQDTHPHNDLPVLHGFGPAGIQNGDIICILFGCSVPVVLRRGSTHGHGEYYTLVGECYVYGLMDGEAIRSMHRRRRDTGKDPSRDFILY